MMRLFSRASRMLFWLIVVITVLVLLSKFLPFLGNLFTSINNFFKHALNGIENTIKNLTK